MSHIKEKAKNFNKTNELLIVVLSVSFGFTALFFSAAELFIRNQKDYLIDARHLLFPMLALALIVSAGFILLLNILLFIHEKLYIVISRLMTGLLISFYIQEMFLNGKMSAITGDPYDAKLKTWEVYLNYFIFFVLLVTPLILHFFREKYPDLKFSQIGKGHAVTYLTGLIFVMQTVGLVGSIAQFGLDKYERLYNSYLSYEPSLSLSKENNVVVFISDRLDSFYMDEILEYYPDMYDELDGFTFYQNNISHYTNTFPSITHMLTGMPYHGETWNNYLTQAWNERIFIDDLKENGFHINLLLDNITTYTSRACLENRCDNLSYLNDTEYDFNYLGENGIVPIMTRLSLGRLVPYFAKSYLINGIRSDSSAKFISYAEGIEDLMPGAVGASSDLVYYDYLKANELDSDNNNKTFSFIHLNGAHDESIEISDLYSYEYVEGTFGTLSTARGDFEIIFEYLRQMKELGIYDNSTIIIVGDHGRPPVEIESFKKDFLESPIVTSLLIKPANADGGALKLDPDTELSNDYLAASVLEYAGIDHSEYGYSYNDIIDNDLHIERDFFAMQYRGFGISIKSEFPYKVRGNARDFENWEAVK